MLEPEADEAVYYESCVIPYDAFFARFDELADPACPHQEVLEALLCAVRAEKLRIDRDRFSLLLTFVDSSRSRAVRHAAYDLILEFAEFPAESFLEMLPSNFVEVIYAALFACRPTKIAKKLIDSSPSVISRLVELGVVDLIISQLHHRVDPFGMALELFESMMKYPDGKPAI